MALDQYPLNPWETGSRHAQPSLRECSDVYLDVAGILLQKVSSSAFSLFSSWVRPVEEHWTSRCILQFQKLCGLRSIVETMDKYER